MKKFAYLIFAAAAMAAGCSGDSGSVPVVLDRNVVELRVGDVQQIKVVAGDADGVRWRSGNEFVASVSEGRITGQHIGRTSVLADDVPVMVTVKGRYFLYDEPLAGLEWGITKEKLAETLGFPDRVEDDTVIYRVESSVNSLRIYEFDKNGRLFRAGVTVRRSMTDQLDDFLAERYLRVSPDGQETVEYIDALVSADAGMRVVRSVYDDDYWMVTYSPVSR